MIINNKYLIEGKSYKLDDSYVDATLFTKYKGIMYNKFIGGCRQIPVIYDDYYKYTVPGVEFGTSCVGNGSDLFIHKTYNATQNPYTVSLTKDSTYCYLNVKYANDDGYSWKYRLSDFNDPNNPKLKLWIGMVGGGGGGGQAQPYNIFYNGPGGGGGGGSIFFPFLLDQNQKFQIDIGKGGAGTGQFLDGGAQNGSDGGETAMYVNDRRDKLAWATGGKGGKYDGSIAAEPGVGRTNGYEAVSIAYRMSGGYGGKGYVQGSVQLETKISGGQGGSSLKNVILADYEPIPDTTATYIGGAGCVGDNVACNYGGGGGGAMWSENRAGYGLNLSQAISNPTNGLFGGGGAGGCGLGINSKGAAGGDGAFKIWAPAGHIS